MHPGTMASYGKQWKTWKGGNDDDNDNDNEVAWYYGKLIQRFNRSPRREPLVEGQRESGPHVVEGTFPIVELGDCDAWKGRGGLAKVWDRL